ncbi:MAG: hypothetical protein Q9226_007372 [Calogaya cf. arnoldii]
MHLIKSLFVGAACAVAAAAQGVSFTATPGVVRPGESSTIKWAGQQPNTDAVISLYQGDANNLDFVRIIESNARNGQFTWRVPADLPNRNDYSLQIDSGFDDNYSGRFTLTGSSAVSSSSSSSSSTSSRSTSSRSTSTVTASSSSSSPSTTGGATGLVVQSVIVTNTTTSVVDNSTTTIPAGGAVGTGVGASGSAATGTAMSRNTTMARPTLSSTSSSSDATSTSEESSSAPTGGAGTEGGSEGGAPSSAMEVASFASPLALILSAVAAIMFLA